MDILPNLFETFTLPQCMQYVVYGVSSAWSIRTDSFSLQKSQPSICLN